MAQNEQAKVDFKSKITEEYAKVIQKQNIERVAKLRRMRKNNLIVGGLLGLSVLSIYSYSILAVRQETFLDDFDEPARDPPKIKN